ncbi:HEPN domain-containing protein [Desulfonema limicola]|uniref:HEPN domain-containing protein n=1 Tax=Desulfonema limicola TaxID=45656 RepID=A0A975BEV6_9BACT|nr:HEPN domain-containing protein [Desulfonema limicola]QTA83859.1 HEPN domain-containing protein [Desulfonema limicola]
MSFKPEHYLEASWEQIDAARRLHNTQHYPAAIYIAGVAVECLLLAYRSRENPEFENRHDLRSLFKESGIAEFIRQKDQRKVSAMLGEVWSRWKNNYRFASYGRLIPEFRRLKLDRGIKGDILKHNSAVLIDYAFEIINLGVRRWTSKKK